MGERHAVLLFLDVGDFASVRMVSTVVSSRDGGRIHEVILWKGVRGAVGRVVGEGGRGGGEGEVGDVVIGRGVVPVGGGGEGHVEVEAGGVD